MKKEEKHSLLSEVSNIKKELMMLRIKASSGETIAVKDFKIKKKSIARLFTKINGKENNNKKTKKA